MVLLVHSSSSSGPDGFGRSRLGGLQGPGLDLGPQPHEGPAAPTHRLGEAEPVEPQVEDLLAVTQAEELSDLAGVDEGGLTHARHATDARARAGCGRVNGSSRVAEWILTLTTPARP